MSKKIIEAEDYTFKKDKCIYNVYAIPDILNNDKVYLFMWEEHFLYMYDITPIMKSKIGKTVEEYVMSR